MKYEYLRLAVTAEHAIIVAICILGIIVLFKRVMVEKAITTDMPNKMLISNGTVMSSIIFMFVTAIAQMAYLTNFFERIPVYYYKIPTLLLLMVAIVLIILFAINKKK